MLQGIIGRLFPLDSSSVPDYRLNVVYDGGRYGVELTESELKDALELPPTQEIDQQLLNKYVGKSVQLSVKVL
ncbi:MAG: hypothetical protein KAT83_02190 [Candidatus Aenigmarchaeota archaeon]|nr:hypothetical protein [Candidatus Aenigmarchaeota archaeon]